MKAVVYHGVGDIRLDDVPEPKLEAPTDAIVRLTASAICGTDLHFVRGTMPGTTEGRILGHEGSASWRRSAGTSRSATRS
jgi:threonine dehydrogenase-like Zn-dependent dehydrogenase